MNHNEAKLCITILKSIISNYSNSNKEIDNRTIGIITPYRAQIACIVDYLQREMPEVSDLISVDTVERYQGGARDHILLSTCLNFTFQLGQISSMSDDGIDRKLNVAFTRAKEQFILIGNKEILMQNDLYSDLVSRCKEHLINS